MRTISLAVLAAALMAAPTAWGQGTEGGQGRPAGSGSKVARSLESVLQKMGRDLGMTILADSSLARAQATLPDSPTTRQNVEDQLDALVKELPRGTVWAKVMLPAPKGRGYRADDVLDYLLAQARLFGTVGSAQAGMVEILGQRVEAPKAEPVVATLGLRPVYLVANPTARVARGGAEGGAEAQIDQMVQGMRGLMNLDPQQRGPAMQALFRSFGEMIQTLSPEQRRDFFGNMMRGLPGGGGERIIIRQGP